MQYINAVSMIATYPCFSDKILAMKSLKKRIRYAFCNKSKIGLFFPLYTIQTHSINYKDIFKCH